MKPSPLVLRLVRDERGERAVVAPTCRRCGGEMASPPTGAPDCEHHRIRDRLARAITEV